jgi:hypothetical protein
MARLSTNLKTASPGETFNPERNLWRNVIIVALEDAVGRHWRNKSYGEAVGFYAQSAKEWFTIPNGDFKTVCTLAGFDHEYVRMKAKNFFEKRRKIYEKENLS